jgi:hypothetical protein
MTLTLNNVDTSGEVNMTITVEITHRLGLKHDVSEIGSGSYVR